MATGQQLQQAYELIKAGYKEHAASVLAVLLVSDPCNADAWWLLALAAPNEDVMRRALVRLMELRPDDLRARQLLDSLGVRQMLADARAAAVNVTSGRYPTYPPIRMEPRLPSLRRRPHSPKRRPRRPVHFYGALLLTGVFGVVGCALLALAVLSGFEWLSHALDGFDPFQTAVQVAQAGSADRPDLGDIHALGNTGYMQVRSSHLASPGERHLYTFIGRSGDWVTIDATTPESDLDPALALYSGSGILVGGNTDRAAVDPDPLLALALPQTGTFTIVVSAQSGQGAYTLMLRH